MTQLAVRNFQLSINGIRHNVFRVKPELDTPIDAIEDKSYWAHVSSLMRPGDLVEVVPEDYSYFASYMVVDAGKLYAIVRRVSYAQLADAAKPTPKGYEIKWSGPHSKFRVVRDKDVLKDGFADRTEAQTWLDEHLKAA